MDTVDAVTAAIRPKLAEAEIRRLTAAADRTMLRDIAGPEAEKRWAEAPSPAAGPSWRPSGCEW